MKHHAEIGVLAKRTWLGIDLNSLDARATEVISTAAAYVRLFENEETYGTLEVLRWRFDEGVIVATPVHLASDRHVQLKLVRMRDCVRLAPRPSPTQRVHEVMHRAMLHSN